MKGNKTSDLLPLPEDLVRNILSRLSVKMLCRCKLVCKEWCGLIQCPDFVKHHFCHESNPDRLLVGCFSMFPGPRENIYLLSIDDSFSIFEELRYLQMMSLSTRMWGALNGVYCVVSNSWPLGPAGLLNPATRQFKPLPLFQHKELGVIYHERGFDFGLGLDPVTGDFKLVLISFCLQLVAVCTSDDDYGSWRLIDGVPRSGGLLTWITESTYLNGKLHWLVDYNDCVHDVVVVAFDMRTEEFKEIKVMSFDEKSWGWGWLSVNGDSSLVLVMEMKGVDQRSISVWTMLEEEGCWITTATMVLPNIICNTMPLYFWKNDEFLLYVLGTSESWENEALISYNVRSQKLWGPIIARSTSQIEHLRFYRYYKYRESLVSLKGKRGNYMFWDPATCNYIKPFFE